MASSVFSIGEAAARARVSTDTIRHYERLRVIPLAPRTKGGYRYYTDASVARVNFIRNAVRFGFGLKELAGFLNACDSGRAPCCEVKVAGDRLLREMDRELAELTEARASMAKTLADWGATLDATAPGTRARLLAMLPDTNAGPRCALTRRHKTS